MGMFDTVVVEGLKLKTSKKVAAFLKANNAELPTEFQTKDLENIMSTYTIDSKGQIYVTEYKPTGRKVKYESPFAGWVDNRPVVEKLYHKFKNRALEKKYPTPRLVEERKPIKVKCKLTETFEIYTVELVNGRCVDIAFNIEAVNGKVKSIKPGKWSIESQTEANKRLADDLEFKTNMEASIAAKKEFQSKWYYPVLRETLNPAIYFTRILVQAGCNKIINWTYRWHGV